MEAIGSFLHTVISNDSSSLTRLLRSHVAGPRQQLSVQASRQLFWLQARRESKEEEEEVIFLVFSIRDCAEVPLGQD